MNCDHCNDLIDGRPYELNFNLHIICCRCRREWANYFDTTGALEKYENTMVVFNYYMALASAGVKCLAEIEQAHRDKVSMEREVRTLYEKWDKM